MKTFTLFAVSALAVSCSMQAAVLTSNNGLAAVGITPVFTLTFDNAPGLSANSSITNQFSFAGVTFSSPAFYDGNVGGTGCSFANEGGDCVSNFTSAAGRGVTSVPTTPFSILFAAPQTYAAFSLVTDANGNNNTTITAFRNNAIVDSGTLTTSISNATNFVGFYNENTPFDRITITTTGMNLVILDNLQVSAVPEPGTVGMLALGIGGLFGFARQRRRSA